MGLKDLLLTASQVGKTKSGSLALAGLLNTPRYDLHVKHLEPKHQAVSHARSSSVGKPNQSRYVQPQPRSVSAPKTGNTMLDGQFQAFVNSIKQQESGGNYSALGVPTRSGRALGAYQVLDTNIAGPGGWDAQVLGREITPQDFLNSPELQDQIAQSKLKDYYTRYGPSGAAKAWYGGEGAVHRNSNGKEYGGPSLNDYAASVISRLR